MNDLLYRRKTGILQSDLGAELVALDPIGGACFGLNEVAASVWRELEEPRSFGELTAMLLAEYEVEPDECTRELRILMDDLEARGMIIRGN